MSVLYTHPKTISLPGAKLTFTQTGTTTPQNTYQEDARTTPHANPVVADAAGIFEPIFLDPTLPNYRVKLTTAADVLIYQEDGIPSNQNTQQSSRLESTNPFVFLYDTDGTSGSRKYRIRAAGNAFEVQASNEAEDTFTTILQFVGGILLSGGTEVAVTTAGTFTGTLTGMTGSVTGTFKYRKVNNIVALWTETGALGTSNTTAMTLTGLPVAIQPSTSKYVSCSDIADNGSSKYGSVQVTAGSVITFVLSTVSGSHIIPGVFTNSGTKGVSSGWTIIYTIA